MLEKKSYARKMGTFSTSFLIKFFFDVDEKAICEFES